MTTDRSAYWVDLAEYDLDTAAAMLAAGRRLYVGFLCHQVMEKMFKAAIAKDGTIPPKVHNLTRLAELSHLADLLSDEQNNFIDALLPLNIEARYPADKDKLLAVLTEAYCRELIAKTEDLRLWIKHRL
jgi:HEPN domain-containing protein